MFLITNDNSNKDLLGKYPTKEAYLELYGDFTSRLPKIRLEEVNGLKVVRCDESPAGFKAFGAEKLIAETPNDTLVYCAPRVGHAAEAISYLANEYGKKCVFFAPASKEVSKHQAVLLAYGADLRFIKIAAMPVLNKYAKDWADKHGAAFLPFGLANTPAVTAGIVKFADNLMKEYGEPEEFWCAVSTGTMIRGLQIGWPNAVPRGVAVARNIKNGEIGRANVYSHHLPFVKPLASELMPAFPTTATYDAKAWDEAIKHAKPGAWFINVGADAVIEQRIGEVNMAAVDSQRAWGDLRDLEMGPR